MILPKKWKTMNSLDEVLEFINSTDTNDWRVYEYTGREQKISLNPGIYSIECWGASGASISDNVQGGNGSYVFGKIRIDSPRSFYAYVGQKGPKFVSTKPFGDGGFSDFCGGGASDIRLIKSNNFESKKSRIIVAAGGGGSDSSDSGGSGGTLEGKQDFLRKTKGATQTSPGTGVNHGKFGVGGGQRNTTDNNGGGGGGYYGGGSGAEIASYGGSGGSSFISGHKGCDAIFANSTEENIYHTGKPYHYSGFVFYDTFMIDGDSEMPSIKKGKTQIGNNGNGHIRIIRFSQAFSYYLTCRRNQRLSRYFIYYLLLPLTFS